MPSLDPAQASLNWLQQVVGLLDSSLRLPNSPRAFMIYLLGLVIVFAGAFMHVLLAAQIMQAEFTLNQLQEEYLVIEQQNSEIIFQIARDTNLVRLQQRVLDEGYAPVQEREYVFLPSERVPDATLVEAATPTEGSAEADGMLAPMVATDATALTATSWGVGQFASWEVFWSTVLRPANGGSTSSNAATRQDMSQKTVASHAASTKDATVQLSKTSPNFWSVWWEHASEQGSKLLDQFSGQ
jgi:hypothetical protein